MLLGFSTNARSTTSALSCSSAAVPSSSPATLSCTRPRRACAVPRARATTSSAERTLPSRSACSTAPPAAPRGACTRVSRTLPGGIGLSTMCGELSSSLCASQQSSTPTTRPATTCATGATPGTRALDSSRSARNATSSLSRSWAATTRRLTRRRQVDSVSCLNVLHS